MVVTNSGKQKRPRGISGLKGCISTAGDEEPDHCSCTNVRCWPAFCAGTHPAVTGSRKGKDFFVYGE